ncbi:hypothetical protein ISF_09585 [Cordyceps fumosorosea ARSEF 2679]|uniref:Uncharacterized protein n=1 Tax=Cordyceps fumosorosea (strain ARSEF 2679) TaxID=1081104 RepID=A0A167FT80_CORFA|nr:hypothetical protein ISF_09585 [Cordyceps fumosorosea ARSEF 2679]OAA45717.1 hypothetical protein ISF_09585 [Cordyceps fumosorosea ARSEF 2679]
MDEAIRALTERKIRELLALVGIRSQNTELPLQHVNGISKFGKSAVRFTVSNAKNSVRDSMHRAGGKEPPACVTRVLTRAAKRCQVDYAGLDRRPAKNRRRVAQSKPSVAGRNTNDPTGANVLADDKLRRGTVLATAVAVETAGPDQAISAKLPVMEGSIPLESLGSSNAAVSITTQPPSAADSVDAFAVTSSVLDFFGSAAALGAVETILRHCVEVNFKFAKYKSGETTVTTIVENIRRYASNMVDLEYDQAVYAVKKSRALAASQDLQVRYNETFYWDIIVKKAKYLDSSTLKNRGGPSDEFTQLEKRASKIFMDQAGIGTSSENQRLRRRVWKSLSDMRKAGVNKLILYRTREFDHICEQNPKHDTVPLVDRVFSWEKVYGPHIADLETRAVEEAKGNSTEHQWLTKNHVAERLNNMPERAWGGFISSWCSAEEKAAFHSTSTLSALSDDMVGIPDLCTGVGTGRNKSIYVILVPQDENFLSVCSIMTIKKGDFLGVYTGYLRYSEDFDDAHGIRGPTEKLWLDYSQVSGVMNQIKVVAPGSNANVSLEWELNDGGTKSPCMWRVAVRALCAIRPFEKFVRVAGQEAQYLLHHRSACARQGFTKSVTAPVGHSDAF